MNILTYGLRNEQNQSDQYYTDISTFTDEVLAEASSRNSSLMGIFLDYINNERKESPRSKLECVFEILLIGTLWENYGSRVYKLPKIPGLLLTGLVKLRVRAGGLKPLIDYWRGILGTKYLAGDQLNSVQHLPPVPENFDALSDWLAATGEYDQEIKRLKAWRYFLAAVPSETATGYINDMISFGQWFKARSRDVLGHYTSGVELFLNEDYPRHYWREDIIQCGKSQAEYHLNMVGGEILGRAFREDFLRTQRKVVLLPTCMRRPETYCRAFKSPFLGLHCSGCSAGCKVFQLTKLGQINGFEVHIIPHASILIKPKSIADRDIGIIGVACVATLISGGLAAKSLDIPAQCILLDYCGCTHWSQNAIPTDINVNQLMKVFGLSEVN